MYDTKNTSIKHPVLQLETEAELTDFKKNYQWQFGGARLYYSFGEPSEGTKKMSAGLETGSFKLAWQGVKEENSRAWSDPVFVVQTVVSIGHASLPANRGRLGQLQSKFEEAAESHLLPKYLEVDPNLKAGYTGSFKTGRVGNPQKSTYGQKIDFTQFDIDFWIESDILFRKYGSGIRADVAFRKVLEKMPGFEGLKPAKKGFSIKFKPSTTK